MFREIPSCIGREDGLTMHSVFDREKADGTGLLPREFATTRTGRKSIHNKLQRWYRHECAKVLGYGNK